MVRAAGDSGFIAWADAVDADGVADAAALAAHLADTVDAHDATAVSFSPAQGIAATTVQAAIEEVVTDTAATYQSVFKPEAYGAVGDGSTDDTAAINSAIAAANAVRGTVALTRNATYKVTAALTALTAGVTFDGYGATISVPAANAVGVLSFGAVDGVTIRRLTISGNGSAKTADAYAISSATGSSNALVENVAISDWHGTGIFLASSDRATLRGCYVTGTTATLSTYGHGIALGVTGGVDTTNAVVDNCHTRLTARSGIVTGGDWNHSDWRTGSYARIVDSTISNCTAHTSGQSASGAGIFVNSGFRVVVKGCHANDSVNDYGIGLEYSRNSMIIGCTAEGNFGHGFALYASDSECSIIDCQAVANGTDGISLDSQPALVSGDTNIDGCVVANCVTRASGRYGLYAGKVDGLTVSGGSYETAADTGIYSTECSDLVVTGVSVADATSNGVRILKATRAQVNESSIKGTAGYGVSVEGASGALSTEVTISGCQISGFASGVRLADVYSNYTFITGCTITGCTNGISGQALAHDVTVTGCRFRNNSTRDITCPGAIDWSVLSNAFHAVLTSVDFQASSGTSSTRITIQNNFFRSGTAMRVSAGSGGSILATDWFIVRDNAMGPSVTPIVYSDMATTTIGITYLGSGSGTPEASIYGNKGSTFRRTDGGAATCFYVKESGNGQTGWVAK